MATIWALFDSGHGAYQRALADNHTVISVGLSVDGNSTATFQDLNLADYGDMFGNNHMWDALDALPTPDVILASPPCESWSQASGAPGGNACWQTQEARLAIPLVSDREGTNFTADPSRYALTRLNGELCALNTARIIRRYTPRAWAVENPYGSRIWRYYRDHLGFTGTLNVAHYMAYDPSFPRKATGFLASHSLDLFTESMSVVPESSIRKRAYHKSQVEGYDKRSDIPDKLVRDVVGQLLEPMTLFV